MAFKLPGAISVSTRPPPGRSLNTQRSVMKRTVCPLSTPYVPLNVTLREEQAVVSCFITSRYTYLFEQGEHKAEWWEYLVNSFDKFFVLPFLHYSKLSVLDSNLQSSSSKGTQEGHLLGVLWYVDEASRANKSRPKSRDIDVAYKIEVRRRKKNISVISYRLPSSSHSARPRQENWRPPPS